jgi:hypothetical protein
MMTLKVGDVVTEIGGPERLVKIAPSVARYEASVRWKVQRFVHSDMVVCRQIKRRGRQVKYFRLGEIQLAETTMQKVEMRSKAIMKHLWSFSVQSCIS